MSDWLKGHLRDRNSASKCSHLKPSILVDTFTQNIEIAPSGLELEPSQKKIVQVKRLAASPKFGYLCECQGVIGHFLGAVEPEVRQQIDPSSIETNLDFCCICPWHEIAGKE